MGKFHLKWNKLLAVPPKNVFDCFHVNKDNTVVCMQEKAHHEGTEGWSLTEFSRHFKTFGGFLTLWT